MRTDIINTLASGIIEAADDVPKFRILITP